MEGTRNDRTADNRLQANLDPKKGRGTGWVEVRRLGSGEGGDEVAKTRHGEAVDCAWGSGGVAMVVHEALKARQYPLPYLNGDLLRALNGDANLRAGADDDLRDGGVSSARDGEDPGRG